MFDTASKTDRRTFLTGLAAVLGTFALPKGVRADATPFSRQNVLDEAQALAAKPYAPPPRVPERLLSLNYDAYRQIRFRKKAAIWGGTPTRFNMELFAPGGLFNYGVDIRLVENGEAFPVPIDSDSFDAPTAEIAELLGTVGKVSGFRLHYPINTEDYKDEFVVFQGASYFRAVSRGQTYGLSARGLAIDVAEPTGEEFPIFQKFWIERPAASADSIVVHALLNSPRVTGAYRFGIYPSAPTRMDVDATLFPRAPLRHVGLGALTSMYAFGTMDRSDTPDYRVAVHDSRGLAIHTGSDEHLWRPLHNPQTLQVSAFMDQNPKGFGLIQRSRDIDDFQDLEAGYHTRPSAWVSPRGDWGEGYVLLVEIPTSSEVNDNIVAYWRPRNPLEPGQPYDFSYQLSWPDDNPLPRQVARVKRSAYGLKLIGRRPQVVVDYIDLPPGVPAADLTIDTSASQGSVLETQVQPVGDSGARVFMTFEPAGAILSELRIQPKHRGVPVGETWLFRWTAR